VVVGQLREPLELEIHHQLLHHKEIVEEMDHSPEIDMVVVVVGHLLLVELVQILLVVTVGMELLLAYLVVA
jgi:hypothetical protein